MPNCQWCGDSFGHRPECPELEVITLRARVAELEAEVSRWRKSFGGHVYVPNEKYSELIALLREAAPVAPEGLESRIHQALA